MDLTSLKPERRRHLLTPVLLLLLTAAVAVWAGAQELVPQPAVDSAGVRLALERLTVLGSALHVGAHPDDENTALLAYLAQGRLVRTGYLSVTRGDGGQNLIGTEKGPLMGVIRTQELLAARRIDGAEQLFTRAIDFGYSKSAEETLALWDREAVLGDVVRAYRRFRPDVVITRFPGDGRGRHGQHTASAILALEALEAAADPARFPEQLGELTPWRVKRVMWNNWRPSEEEIAAADPPLVSVELGAFNPLLGRSYTELAALSRSMHKSQGFGSAGRRGPNPNYFEHLAGEVATGDLFDGVDLTWGRVPGGEEVGALLEEAVAAFDPDRPWEVVPTLLRAHRRMTELPPDPWVRIKQRELAEVARAASGLWLEAVAGEALAAPGEEVAVTVTALNRSPVPWRLAAVELTHAGSGPAGIDLASNQPAVWEATATLPADLPPSQPYWLQEPPEEGVYRVPQPELAGLPEGPPALTARFLLEAEGETLAYEVPVLYGWTDPVQGERYRRFQVAPRVTLALEDGVLLFPDAAPRTVRAVVRAQAPSVRGTLSLRAPAGFRVEPETADFSLTAAGEEAAFPFTVTPPDAPTSGTLAARAEVGGRTLSWDMITLDHSHIPVQTLFPPAETRLVRLELSTPGRRIGYVMGAGDEVPEALRRLGYEVTLLSDEELAEADLSVFDAVVLGVRAYNTRERLAEVNDRLLAYVAAGGTVVAQYSTSYALAVEHPGPYPFELSRGRVTVEGAPVTLLKPEHPLLTRPNTITARDFEGWVQERGLYFAGEWDPRYETVLASADPGEEELPGALLYARYGEGVYIYTGLSFFRQLPAGVPGAYRLFVNLIEAR